MRAILLAILVGAGLACDPCSSLLPIHQDRCAAGMEESCLWVDGYMAANTCPD